MMTILDEVIKWVDKFVYLDCKLKLGFDNQYAEIKRRIRIGYALCSLW